MKISRNTLQTTLSLPLLRGGMGLGFVLCLLLSIVACEETDDTVNEYADWQPRNEQYFKDTLSYACSQVDAAKRLYGEDWETHCDWRVFPSYCIAPGGKATWKDSIAVHVIEHGSGSGMPLYTDSVRVTYAGRLIPSPSFKTGYCFDHTGLSSKIEDIMDKRFEVPATFKTSNLVEGFTTALLHMHIGDYWRVFMPANLGYGKAGSDNIPGHSTLLFDMRLKAYYRTGANIQDWK